MMKLISLSAICIVVLGVESQFLDQNQNAFNYGQYRQDGSRAPSTGAQTRGQSVLGPNSNQNTFSYGQSTTDTNITSVAGAQTRLNPLGPTDNYRFGPNTEEQRLKELTEFDSYLQTIIRRNNHYPGQQVTNSNIQFNEPSVDLAPPPFSPSSSQNYYSEQVNKSQTPANRPEPSNIPLNNVPTGNVQDNQMDQTTRNNVTVALSRFGLNLLKSACSLQPGNVIVSPTSVATVLALLQQGATGESLDQITKALQMTPNTTEVAYGTITANMRKRNSRNHLSIANNILVADAFELNNAFKSVAIRSFWSEVTSTSFANPSDAIQRINSWVENNTRQKIKNLLQPGSLSTNTQLVLVNAVYFKGIWETKFKPEKTKPGQFYLPNGAKKTVPFMHTRHSFKVGIDPATRALVTFLPFESRQYTLMLILPAIHDTVDNVLNRLNVEQLLYYHTFSNVEIKVEIPKFTLKTDTNLTPVLKDLGISNIFGSKSDLSGIGLYRTFSPQISNAVHSGYLSIDEQGVTAAAATSIAAVALSFDDSTTTFRADRPFIVALWDQQFSIPLFIAKIEDPS